MSLKMVIPKGRMYDRVRDLLGDAGIHLKGAERDYRPASSDPELVFKMLKSANIPPMVDLGQHDCGFAGMDWVKEQKADVEVVTDLGFDPVRIVACIPESWSWNELKKRPIIAVSEYRNLCSDFLRNQGVDFRFIRSYGATEVFPPEDADLVVDNTSSGATLVANRLAIIDTIMTSSTCFIANRRALEDPWRRDKIEKLSLLFNSVLQGRSRVLLEMNCPSDRLEALVDLLPCMKSPTISRLYKEQGFAVKAAVPKNDVRNLIPQLMQAGATDILETAIRKVIP